MSIKSTADQYFSSINSIASRLCTDMNETKSAYDKLWYDLSQEEQNQILNESIIKPEACLQYSSICSKGPRRKEYATKTIVDDNCSYRDEHSAPFSFRTPSQRDLTIIEKTSSNPESKQQIQSKKPKQLKKEKEVFCNEDERHDLSDAFSAVPKTGLDFLDNW